MTGRHELCTVVDTGYLARGVTLHRSLVESGAAFRLRILCMDDVAKQVLDELDLPHVETVGIGELESFDPALVEARSSRSLEEYCWALKPSLVLHLLEREPELGHIAYVDADHLFWADPAPVFDALGDGTALVVPQRTEADSSAGRFNAGFILFRRSEPTAELLRWWRDRCLEWSFAGVGGGSRRFGDQGYLAEWPERFPGVRIAAHPGAGLAPWNSAGAVLGPAPDGGVLVDGRPLLFYHHQSFRLYEDLWGVQRAGLLPGHYRRNRAPVPFVWSIGRWYDFVEPERTLVWTPYARRISEAIDVIRQVRPEYDVPRVRLPRRLLAGEVARRLAPRPGRAAIRRVRRVLRGAHD